MSEIKKNTPNSQTRRYYAFEFKGGLNTTTGSPNRKTGRLSIAGKLAVFTDKAARDDWAYRGKTTSDMRGNCRAAINKARARDLSLGMSIADFNELVDSIVDYEVKGGSYGWS